MDHLRVAAIFLFGVFTGSLVLLLLQSCGCETSGRFCLYFAGAFGFLVFACLIAGALIMEIFALLRRSRKWGLAGILLFLAALEIVLLRAGAFWGCPSNTCC